MADEREEDTDRWVESQLQIDKKPLSGRSALTSTSPLEYTLGDNQKLFPSKDPGMQFRTFA